MQNITSKFLHQYKNTKPRGTIAKWREKVTVSKISISYRMNEFKNYEQGILNERNNSDKELCTADQSQRPFTSLNSRGKIMD